MFDWSLDLIWFHVWWWQCDSKSSDYDTIDSDNNLIDIIDTNSVATDSIDSNISKLGTFVRLN